MKYLKTYEGLFEERVPTTEDLILIFKDWEDFIHNKLKNGFKNINTILITNDDMIYIDFDESFNVTNRVEISIEELKGEDSGRTLLNLIQNSEQIEKERGETFKEITNEIKYNFTGVKEVLVAITKFNLEEREEDGEFTKDNAIW